MKTVEQLIEERLITEKDGYTDSRVSIDVIVTIAKLYANQKLDEARQIVGTGTHENVRLGISALKDQI